MHTGVSVFSREEVDEILTGAGYVNGTDAYINELRRCFQPVIGCPDCYIELKAVRTCATARA